MTTSVVCHKCNVTFKYPELYEEHLRHDKSCPDDLAHRATGLNLDRFAQDLRLAHCARTGDHPCVGTCTITAAGVSLSCKVCGSGEELLAPSKMLDEVRAACVVLSGLGVDWDDLTPEMQRKIYARVKATGLVRRPGES